MEAKFFTTVADLRRWFRTNGKNQTELYVGFYRKEAAVKAVTYPEALDEALCWGWIDGVRKKVDDIRYTNRFTPRRPNSIWSLVNIKHVERLLAEGRMMPAGLAAFENRKAERSGVYSFERAVIFTTCQMLVQQLLRAKRDLQLERMIQKLSKFEALIIDDLGYVQQSREEMEVLFTLLAERYERGSVSIGSNLKFSNWDQIFKDPLTTQAAIDRMIHHSVIIELNIRSKRFEEAEERLRQSGVKVSPDTSPGK